MLHCDVLGERARLTPDQEALVIVDSRERLNYRQLDQRALALAHGFLGSLRLRKGDRLGFLSGNRIEFLDAYFAAAKSGVILVPLSTRATAHELETIIRDCGLSVLIHSPEFSEIAAQLPVDRRILIGTPEYDRLYAQSDELMEPCDPEDLYCLLYTSGTTGKPKGVMIPHRMVAWNGYNTAVCWDLRADDRSPIFTPLYHAGGLGAFLIPIITIGGTIILHSRFDVGEIWRTIEGERCTVVLGVPTIWKFLMEAPEFPAVDLSHVRAFFSGGAPLPDYLIKAYQARGVVFKQGFGMTEVGVNCFSMTVEDSVRKAGSIGRPLMYTRARLVDASGREVPPGEVGELQLRGPHVSSGYWNNPAATAEAYGADGWFRTGDYARRDEEDFFYIAGRKKEMFISGGVNIYPAEIEAELVQHPSISDAAVLGVPDEVWGEVGIAFVVTVGGSRLSDAQLNEHLALRISKMKLPRRYIILDALPRTPYGKVEKNKLRAML